MTGALAEVLRASKEGRRAAALARLRELYSRGALDPAELEQAGRLVLKEPDPSRPKVLLLGQLTTTWLKHVVAAVAHGRGLPLEVVDGGYDSVQQTLSGEVRADVLVLVPWNTRILGADPRERLASELASWGRAWALARERGIGRLVQVGYDVMGPGPHGYASPVGALSTVREANHALRAALPEGAYFVDLEAVAAEQGRASFYDPRQHHWTKQPMSELGLAALAEHIVAGIRATLSGPKKVLVLDLDDTLWGGVVGELGPLGVGLGESPDGEAFLAFQRHVRALSERGVVLAVASKNNLEDAKEPFRRHRDMALRLEDIASFQACWEPKSRMISRIAEELSLGTDSFVFFDDNPAEREEVRQHQPEVAVVEVPPEPAEYVRALERGLWFETTGLTAEDRARAAQYAAERGRRELQASAGSMEEYLASLDMVATVAPIDEADMQRVVQLIGKTNQFNLTTRRHSADEVRRLAASGGLAVTLRLRDRFGDHGLVSVLIAVPEGDALRVDTWLMSCRVIGRTAEELLFGVLLDFARSRGVRRLVGEYLPTPKNGLVKDLYPRLGFAEDGGRFVLELAGAVAPKTSITRR